MNRDPMSQFNKRFKRLLDFADQPLPGDHVLIGKRSTATDRSGQSFVGRIGVVKKGWGYSVEFDGKVVDSMSPNSLEVVEDD